MSADPNVQDPTNAQSLNRYSYVLNNPLSYTDPTGYFFDSLFDFISNIPRMIYKFVTHPAVIMFATAIITAGFGGLALTGNVIADGAITGAVIGGMSGGDLQSLVTGAISGAIFAQVGNLKADWNLANGSLGAAALSATAGGVTSVIQGRDFKSGFLAAGLGELAGPKIESLTEDKATRMIAHGLVGGTAAALGGGKFANGAITAAFKYAANDSQAHTSFKQRAAAYRWMAAELKRLGIDTVWFDGAAVLNELFANENLLFADAYLNEMGDYLLTKNTETFSLLKEGGIKFLGAELDAHLVDLEQGYVEGYMKANPPGALARSTIRAAFSSSVRPSLIDGHVRAVQSQFDMPFDFFNKGHRIALGNEMMSEMRKALR